MRKYITLLLLGFLQASPLLAKQGKEPKNKPKSYKTYLIGAVGVGVLVIGGVFYFRDSKIRKKEWERERERLEEEDMELQEEGEDEEDTEYIAGLLSLNENFEFSDSSDSTKTDDPDISLH